MMMMQSTAQNVALHLREMVMIHKAGAIMEGMIGIVIEMNASDFQMEDSL